MRWGNSIRALAVNRASGLSELAGPMEGKPAPTGFHGFRSPARGPPPG